MSGSNRRACSMASATVPGLGDDLESLAAVEQRDEALADDLVVVDDQEPVRVRGISDGQAGASAGPMGSRTMIRVPLPARSRSRACRRRRRARSRRLASPKCVAVERAPGSNPTPSSSTRSTRLSPSTSTASGRVRRLAVAGDVAEGLPGDLDERVVGRRVPGGRRARRPARRRRPAPIGRAGEHLAGHRPAARPRARHRSPVRGATMNCRMSPIVVCRRSMARSIRVTAASPVRVDQLRHLLEREASRRRCSG